MESLKRHLDGGFLDGQGPNTARMAYSVSCSSGRIGEAAWFCARRSAEPLFGLQLFALARRFGQRRPQHGLASCPRHGVVRSGAIGSYTDLYQNRQLWGISIFDWEWANIAQRVGVDYYPKLVVGVPFTPATGPRLLVHPNEDREPIAAGWLKGCGS